jgi:hypothetical protein
MVTLVRAELLVELLRLISALNECFAAGLDTHNQEYYVVRNRPLDLGITDTTYWASLLSLARALPAYFLLCVMYTWLGQPACPITEFPVVLGHVSDGAWHSPFLTCPS